MFRPIKFTHHVNPHIWLKIIKQVMKKANITIVKWITKSSVIYIVKDAAGENPSSTNEKIWYIHDWERSDYKIRSTVSLDLQKWEFPSNLYSKIFPSILYSQKSYRCRTETRLEIWWRKSQSYGGGDPVKNRFALLSLAKK